MVTALVVITAVLTAALLVLAWQLRALRHDHETLAAETREAFTQWSAVLDRRGTTGLP